MSTPLPRPAENALPKPTPRPWDPPQEDFRSKPVDIHRQPGGLFSNEKIEKGSIVDVCPTTPVSEWQVTGSARGYTFLSPTEGHLLLPASIWMFVNQNPDPNIEALGLEDGSIVFRASRDIQAGDELTVGQNSNKQDHHTH